MENQTLKPETEDNTGTVLKVVAVGDTHGNYKDCENLLKDRGDIFIHIGDFTKCGVEQDFVKFYQFLEKLDFTHKLVIAGNHEYPLDNGCIDPEYKKQILNNYSCKFSRQQIIQEINKRATYLEHQVVLIEGLKVFASPYNKRRFGTAFQYSPQEANELWKQIPDNLDILITHGPPFGILDVNKQGQNSGCKSLLQRIKQAKPKYHLFGHIHEARGKTVTAQTTFMNVAYYPQAIHIEAPNH